MWNSGEDIPAGREEAAPDGVLGERSTSRILGDVIQCWTTARGCSAPSAGPPREDPLSREVEGLEHLIRLHAQVRAGAGFAGENGRGGLALLAGAYVALSSALRAVGVDEP